MDRDQFLGNWQPYPCAPDGCQSLSRWRKEPGWVGGRFGCTANGSIFICSAQTDPLLIQWTSTDPLPPFRPGDHVAFLLNKQNPDGSWNAEKSLMLAPAKEGMNASLPFNFPGFVHRIRDFFLKRGFLEIETPSLVECPGLEPALEPFSTELQEGSRRRTLHFPTSPEIHLKKALCLGFTDIFEIKSCYRNGEVSEHHQPEFQMLEWYRAYAGLDLIIDDLRELLLSMEAPPIEITTFQKLFRLHLGVDLTPRTSREELWAWCEKNELHPHSSDSSADLFHRLWLAKMEPELRQPTIVRDFPPDQAALARLKTDGWADRFEFFWNGMEIANAFHEVNDPREQYSRWEMEKRERDRLEKTRLDGDQDLLAKMNEQGLPPTGGIALGVERLFMAAHGIKDIRSLKLFPF